MTIYNSQLETDIEKTRILFCINFLYSSQRIKYLFEVISAASDWGSNHVDCIIFIEKNDPVSIDTIKHVCFKLIRKNFTISISSHPEVSDKPRSLSWCHKNKIQESFNENNSYTHYVYTEESTKITKANIEYFIRFWGKLNHYGLLPGLVRYEYNNKENDIFNSDQNGKQNIADKARVMVNDIEFITLNIPYSGSFIMDSRDMNEYIFSRSFSIEKSKEVVAWGEVERAAMGLTWEKIPQFFPSRVVIPLKNNTSMPDPMCWVHHLPDSYTNDYNDGPNYILGKTRMDAIFQDLDQPLRAWRIASCFCLSTEENVGLKKISTLYKSTPYSRNKPILLADEKFIDQIESINRRIEEEEYCFQDSIIVKIADLFLFGSVLYPIIDNKICILDETYRKNDRPFVNAPMFSDLLDQIIYDEQNLEGVQKIFLGSAGSSNYGHWITDDFPRLEAAYYLREIYPDHHIQIILNSFYPRLDEIKEQGIMIYLNKMDNFSIKFISNNTTFNIKNIHYVTPVGFHPTVKYPEALNMLNYRINSSIPKNKSRLLFVCRQPPDTRCLINHEEINSILSLLGFDTIVIGNQTFEEQVQAFASADIIVGCMGAAMSNIVFSKKKTQIIMLAPEGWVEPYYWDLAAAMGLSYSAIYGKTNDCSESIHLRSYEINTSLLLSMINKKLLSFQ